MNSAFNAIMYSLPSCVINKIAHTQGSLRPVLNSLVQQPEMHCASNKLEINFNKEH